VTELANLDTSTVDMLSVVLVGSSETRISPDGNSSARGYTPRGYAQKAGSRKGSANARELR
ncbi:MAG: hypothetical protein HN400_13065, partial [Nitrospinaceae bacterium]|nr:hypothetical protein [Nitrospinaceae bacterium]